MFKKKLDNNGERVDITYDKRLDFERLDLYQKSHYKRYEFACDYVSRGDVCGDFACGTGYGSVMLAQKAQKVIGADWNAKVIKSIRKRYKKVENVEFINADLLDLKYNSLFDIIVSFETIEHLKEEDIYTALDIYRNALKPSGKLIFSTPYKQKEAEGHHLTFNIDEERIKEWLAKSSLKLELFKYQNYDTHIIADDLEKKDFIICIVKK